MSIYADAVRHLEALAALRLSDADRERLGAQLEHILEYVEQLRAIDVEGVEPTALVIETRNVLRPDGVRASLSVETVLGNAPETRGAFYRVPRFVGDTETES